MPQSLSKIVVHIIFSTKARRPFLDARIRPEMHAYVATIARNLGCEAYRVGGVADHIHIGCSLSRTVTVSKLVEVLKKDSSKWIKQKRQSQEEFYWQNGCGAFSVSPQNLDDLLAYIANQEEHHRRQTYQDEYLGFLRKYGIEYDEKYLWD